jgi:transcriptional regulator with XRE-family HTH domain
VAKPEIEPETDLGKRLRLLRKSTDKSDQKSFAVALGVSQSALSSYERGQSDPSSKALAAYARLTGVSLDWLLTGEGGMFSDPEKSSPARVRPEIDPVVIGEIGRLLVRVEKELGIDLPAIVLLAEQARSWNALVERAEDPRDTEELLSLLPWLEARMRRTLKDATDQPGPAP